MGSLDELPKPIQEHILKAINDEEYEPMPNTFGVTEVLGCIRQTFLRKEYEDKHIDPETGIGKGKPFDLDSSYAFYRGKVFDRVWTPLFKRNQIRCTYPCVGAPVTVSGHFDFIWDGAVWDLKTNKNLYFVKTASKQYCKQVRFYGFCNSLTKGKLLYVDMGGIKVFDVPMDNIRETTIKEIDEKASILYYALHTYYCDKCFKSSNSLNGQDEKACPFCGQKTKGIRKAPSRPVFEADEKWHCEQKYCSYWDECQAADNFFQLQLF